MKEVVLLKMRLLFLSRRAHAQFCKLYDKRKRTSTFAAVENAVRLVWFGKTGTRVCFCKFLEFGDEKFFVSQFEDATSFPDAWFIVDVARYFTSKPNLQSKGSIDEYLKVAKLFIKYVKGVEFIDGHGYLSQILDKERISRGF